LIEAFGNPTAALALAVLAIPLIPYSAHAGRTNATRPTDGTLMPEAYPNCLLSISAWTSFQRFEIDCVWAVRG
jgi:hypothetical protein